MVTPQHPIWYHTWRQGVVVFFLEEQCPILHGKALQSWWSKARGRLLNLSLRRGSHDPNPNADLTGAPQVSILPSLNLVHPSKQDFALAKKPMQSSWIACSSLIPAYLFHPKDQQGSKTSEPFWLKTLRTLNWGQTARHTKLQPKEWDKKLDCILIISSRGETTSWVLGSVLRSSP